MRRNKLRYLYLAIFLSLVLVDQAAKLIVVRFYPSLLSSNNGGAFGVGARFDFYLVITLLVLASVLTAYFFSEPKYKIPLIFIIAGGVSNQIDRIFKDGVIDFIDFKFWPSFNLADSLIFVGVCLVLLKLFRRKEST